VPTAKETSPNGRLHVHVCRHGDTVRVWQPIKFDRGSLTGLAGSEVSERLLWRHIATEMDANSVCGETTAMYHNVSWLCTSATLVHDTQHTAVIVLCNAT